MKINLFRGKSILLLDFLFVFAILFLAYLPYLHVHVPDVEEVQIFGSKLSVNYYDSFMILAYVLSLKLVLLFTFSIWFISNKGWWGYGLLIPISVFAFQSISVFIEGFFSKLQDFQSILFSILYLIVLVYLRRKLEYYSKSVNNKFHINADNVFSIPFQKLSWVKRRAHNSPDGELKGLVSEVEDINERIERNKIFSNFKGKKKWRRISVTIFFLTVFSPLFLYIHELIPKEGNSLDILGITLTVESFESIRLFFWLLEQKFFLIIYLSLWFMFEKHWWKYVLLLPISFGVFEVMEITNTNSNKSLNEDEYLNAMPVVIIVIVILTFISYKLKGYFEIDHYKGSIEKRISVLLTKTANFREFSGLQEEFDAIKKRKSDLSEEEYLATLNGFKRKLLDSANDKKKAAS